MKMVIRDSSNDEMPRNFISKLQYCLSKGLPHADPVPTLRIDEKELVCGILHMLQGFPSSLFYMDEEKECFHVKRGVYVSHFSITSLANIVDQFVYTANCLNQIELFVKKVSASRQRAPTVEAFANSVHLWLERLRDIALKEEAGLSNSDTAQRVTLLGLTNTLSSLCCGADYLLQVVAESIPGIYFEDETSLASYEIAVHILDHLFKLLNDACLVHGGEESAYHMLLAIFAESLLPYLEGLNAWLYEGILDDPYEEMFFYANTAVAIAQPAFWEKSYLTRTRECSKSRSSKFFLANDTEAKFGIESGNYQHCDSTREKYPRNLDSVVCPLFLKDMSRAIVSAGKSLQLIGHAQDDFSAPHRDLNTNLHNNENANPLTSDKVLSHKQHEDGTQTLGCVERQNEGNEFLHHIEDYDVDASKRNPSQLMGVLTLSEVFLVSLSGLVEDGSEVHRCFGLSKEIPRVCKTLPIEQNLVFGIKNDGRKENSLEKTLFKFLSDAELQRRSTVMVGGTTDSEVMDKIMEKDLESVNLDSRSGLEKALLSLCARNPVTTVCRKLLKRNLACWNDLNISSNFFLPPLNDEKLREAIFGERDPAAYVDSDVNTKVPGYSGTDYMFGFQFNKLEQLRLKDDIKNLDRLCPFPTLLPSFQDDFPISDVLPFQKNCSLASRVLAWIQDTDMRATCLPAAIIEKCLVVHMKNQVDYIGKLILLKLMNEWKLMDELGVLRAIYLLGSGDLLQHFQLVIFKKLDRGEPLDDEFELNTVLQESLRYSADGGFLSTSDSLVVSASKTSLSGADEKATGLVSSSSKHLNRGLGINDIDILHFTYKVSWPLDLIANVEAIKKYNQVIQFLLKIKHAKYVLDKVRRWMWKERGHSTENFKYYILVEQKLLHFVDAFHQYVMDKVLHSAWVELCTGMAFATSLDEVIEVHEAYLLSIQRQCFVAPDQFWALIANRIKSILGLALDFYFIQRTLSSGAPPVIKERCKAEVVQVERQFDECIAFLLRILSFKLNVGQFPHLADLVNRINYNNFYMSETGNLKTMRSFESAGSKLGSIFRTE